jgi:catechol 2,3-dioxygenase-like lactoylglutathione lyase family enzyme
MFDHVKFGVSDYPASRAFFLKALEPLGVTAAMEWPPNGVELSQPNGKVSLCLYQSEEKPAHLHLAFVAENRQQVEAFYRAALEAGGKDNGAPGLRLTVTTSKRFAKRPRPNPSLEPTRSGKAHWPPRAQYYVAPVGQWASPPRSAQLKRYAPHGSRGVVLQRLSVYQSWCILGL